MRKHFCHMTLIVSIMLICSPCVTAQSLHSYGNNVGDFDPPGGYFEHSEYFSAPMIVVPPLLRKEDGDPFVDPLVAPGMEAPIPASDATSHDRSRLAGSGLTDNNAIDPDTSEELRSLWSEWHRRVSEAVSSRFESIPQRIFAKTEPLSGEAVYTIDKNRKIINVRLLKKSNNIVFNSWILMSLKSMNGNPILEFPQGTKREFVTKTGTFSRTGGGGSKGAFICDPPMDRKILPMRQK